RVAVGPASPRGDEVLPGAAAEQHVPWPGHGRSHLTAHHLVVVPLAPAAEREAAAGVLVRTAEALHDAVQGDPPRDRDRTTGPAPFRAAARLPRPLTSTRTTAGEIDTAARHARHRPVPGSDRAVFRRGVL